MEDTDFTYKQKNNHTIDNLHNKLKVELGKNKEHLKISKIAKFGGEML